MTPKERAENLIHEMIEKVSKDKDFKSEKMKSILIDGAIETIDNFLNNLQKMHDDLNVSIEPEDQYPYWLDVKKELENMK
jgi:hypothetical protein